MSFSNLSGIAYVASQFSKEAFEKLDFLNKEAEKLCGLLDSSEYDPQLSKTLGPPAPKTEESK